MNALAKSHDAGKRKTGTTVGRYRPPTAPRTTTLQTLLHRLGHDAMGQAQLSLLTDNSSDKGDLTLWYAGDLQWLQPKSVSVVGAREVSEEGGRRAHRVARELASAGVTVVSGLAAGVDTFALTGAMKAGGKVVAVIGTALDKATPTANSSLQEEIYREHLLISQFPVGAPVYKTNFPARNRTMAALSAGTLIVEASDTSGTLHQAAECARLNRWLFVMKSVMADDRLEWPKKFAASKKFQKFIVVESVQDILQRL